jgi:putative ABC transport system permease protein
MRVVAFCAAAVLFVGLLFGIAPAWQATRFSLPRAIASETRTTTGGSGRLRSLLVAGEVATAVLLLFGAGLLLRTLSALQDVDRGYRAEGVLTMIVDPLGSRYPTDASLLQFFDQVEREVTSVPGVRTVAWASSVPLGSPAEQVSFELAGRPPPDQSLRPMADYKLVSPGYFRTIGLPIVTGRGFDGRDTGAATPVCIVSEAFVRRHLPGKSPIGARIATRPADSAQSPPVIREIVGVARQVKGRLDEKQEVIQIYVPMAQNPSDDIFLLVGSSPEQAGTLAPAVRAAIGRVDVEQLVSVRDVMTLEEVERSATASHRFRAVLVLTFAGLALILAMVGVFGVLAYAVQQRTRELGVRRALGAKTRDVLRLVIGSAARVVATGAIIGLALSAALGRLLSTMLYGVQPLDPATFALVVVALVLTAAVATAGPAWRATRVDPAVALRGD